MDACDMNNIQMRLAIQYGFTGDLNAISKSIMGGGKFVETSYDDFIQHHIFIFNNKFFRITIDGDEVLDIVEVYETVRAVKVYVEKRPMWYTKPSTK